MFWLVVPMRFAASHVGPSLNVVRISFNIFGMLISLVTTVRAPTEVTFGSLVKSYNRAVFRL